MYIAIGKLFKKWKNLENIICLETRKLSLVEILQKVVEVKNETIKGVLIYAETRLKDTNDYQNFDGVTILKHILLDKENEFYKLPILLVHITPFEKVLRKHHDNILVLSKNVMTSSILDFQHYNLETLENLFSQAILLEDSKELSPYIIYNEEDDMQTSHDERNQAGAKRMLKEWEGNFNFIEEPLYFKKQIWLQNIKFEKIEELDKQNLQNNNFIKKILVIDDEWEKWEGTFSKLFSSFDLVSKNSFDSAGELIDLAQGAFENAISKIEKNRYNKESIENIHFGKNNNLNFLNTTNNSVSEFISTMNYIWDYDIIFLDLRDNESDNSADPYNYKGYKILQKLHGFCPATPVIIFSATQQTKLIKYISRLGYTNLFVKGVDSISKIINIFSKYDFLSYSQIRNIYWKNELVKELRNRKVNFFNIKINYKDQNVVLKKARGGQLGAIDIILKTIDNVILNSRKFNFENQLKPYKKLDFISQVFPLFMGSEIRFEEFGKSIEEDDFVSRLEVLVLMKNEINYRRIRNSWYHSKNVAKFDEIDVVFMLCLINYTLDWFINPLEIPEVRDFFNNLNKK